MLFVPPLENRATLQSGSGVPKRIGCICAGNRLMRSVQLVPDHAGNGQT